MFIFKTRSRDTDRKPKQTIAMKNFEIQHGFNLRMRAKSSVHNALALNCIAVR